MNIDLFGNIIVEEVETITKREKVSPFDYLKNIADKNRPEQIDDYVPFIVNLALSQRKDTVVYANEMNKYHQLSNSAQFDFYYHSLPKRNLFAKWNKAVKTKHTEMIMAYFEVSYKVAKQYEIILKEEQLKKIEKWFISKEGGK